MIERTRLVNAITAALKRAPVVALLGARQVGKTTLARSIFGKTSRANYFDLEDITDATRLSDPLLALEDLKGTIVIDEVQRAPSVFETLRVLVDRPNRRARFLVLGSASRDLICQSSDSLAGRITYIEISPFNYLELPAKLRLKHWLRGGYPGSILARSDTASAMWRKDYIATFLERDIPSFGIRIAAPSMLRFWIMLAGLHGQLVNYSELGRSFGLSDTNVRRYLDVLTETFMIRQLQPWHENIGKRQVKAPKIYVRDSGLLHSLLSLPNHADLVRSRSLGASWEGFALEEVLRCLEKRNEESFFWRTHTGAELDLLLPFGRERIGIEFKYGSAPSLTPSMRIATEDLKLRKLYVIYPQAKRYKLNRTVEVVGLDEFLVDESLKYV